MLEVSYQKTVLEAGCDEAGRGCLAGPLYAAAVILPDGFYHPLLNDSKQMSEKNRYVLRDIIMKEAVCWEVEEVSAGEIDRINILKASFEGMSRASVRLKPAPGLLLIDGNRFITTIDIPFKCIIGGDGLYANIAAASVLAKTFRDDKMREIGKEYPHYGWDRNKGYPTKEHKIAIIKHGISPFHRVSFNPDLTQPSLFVRESFI